MPGISEECSIGAHQQCTMGLECRCAHHAHTQALVTRGPAKPDPRGGIRRQLKKSPAAPDDPTQSLAEEVPAEIHNTCPECAAHARPTDIFCRKDGSRLMLGKQCLGCGAPGDPEDLFCWQCGLKSGDKPAILPPPEPQEDPLLRVHRKAVQQGLLQETITS